MIHTFFYAVLLVIVNIINECFIQFADSWQQVGLMLVTGFNCGWIFSFSNLIMVPLGWTWGIILLFVIGLYTAYANWLLAAFHFIDGRRFIRYRDLMGFVYGQFFIIKFFVQNFILQKLRPHDHVTIFNIAKNSMQGMDKNIKYYDGMD